ncbi:aspartate/glutamate racemase family protein [Rothia sp. AR01]|uniref:Aspartate/glutamate racemase family protein n=1 Tax=Rothia santali TaxID=2949643 RepID=A0A9X2KJC2_9MICC|nr:aspartate/glutamate racemase family protein [Rothia santali]MCP3426955.1 aspartate/glutamate racemase family protein [Rothia santali]
MIYTTDSGNHPSGVSVGVIMMDARVPYPPGSPNNAETFPFPVTYECINEANYDSLIYVPRFDELLDRFIEAGQRLVSRGVKAVVGSCGFMVLFQRELSEALPVPVFSSSLLQIPLIAQTISPARKIGIVTFSGDSLSENHMGIATGNLPIDCVVHGLENRPAFRSAVHEESGILDFDAVESDVVAEALDMQERNPDIGSILLECTDLPPYAAAVAQATSLPVYDVNSLIFWAYSAIKPRTYGHHAASPSR